MQGYDYSITGSAYRPHDLVWIDVAALPADTPAWALTCMAEGAPAVVRRAPRKGRSLPVGIRGAYRGQRHATVVDHECVRRCIAPETLIGRRGERVPALACLARVGVILSTQNIIWGITGAVGFELASAISACHVESDLDLLVRAPERLTREQARRLHASLAVLPVRCDVQLETPAGAIALAEWAGAAEQVLVKSDTGPWLSADPWAGIRDLSIAPCDALTQALN
ncbi:malonate decarboxylase holo-ACP synthase [Salinisphaera aquimarina]